MTLIDAPVSPGRKIALIRGGMPARIFDEMAAYLGLPRSQLLGYLRAPASTAHRLMVNNHLLDADSTERVVRVADVAAQAEEAFGGRARATEWLRTPNRALDGQAPLALLDTEPGAFEVRRVLAAIEHGGVY